MTIEFNDFTQGLGLDRYPFSVFTAEEEKEFLRVAFVRPIAYSPAIQAAREGKNIFLYGERGTGKTALLFELVSERSKAAKVAQVSNFSDLPLVPGRADIYGLYVSTLTDLLFKKLLPQMSNVVFERPKLDRDDKVLVSYLLKNHTSTLSRAALREDLRKIQHGRLKRGAAWVFNFFRGVANQAANTGVDIASHTIRQSLGLPDPSENEASSAKDYFERIELAVDSDFDEGKANALLLKKTVELCHKLGVKPITLVLDRIDEDSRLRNDSAVIANFLRPFLVENEIFYGNDLQFIFSIWSIPFQNVKSDFRANKFCVEQVQWRDHELINVLDKRLKLHSNNKVTSYSQLFGDPTFFNNNLLPLANANPRDLWQLMNQVLREQYQLDPTAKKVSTEAMQAGMKSFVKNFSYYEYYPRKIDARANSLDVYSYISHLRKLSDCQFTISSLATAAGTGGSTGNYVVGMEGIGLIRKCEDKGPNGATLYEVKDPKVRFAIMNRIDIRRDA
jgi:Cdc6-like AAA superfamily ATPase